MISDRVARITAAMAHLGPATSREIIAEAGMAPTAGWSTLGYLVQTYRATVTKASRQRKLYELKPQVKTEVARTYQTPTVVLSGTVASRAQLLDPAVAGRITERTRYVRCPSSPVYSNVQTVPGEKVPVIFRGVPGLDPMTGRPW